MTAALWVLAGVVIVCVVGLPLLGGVVWLLARYFPKHLARVLGLPAPRGPRGHYAAMPPTLSDQPMPPCPPSSRPVR